MRILASIRRATALLCLTCIGLPALADDDLLLHGTQRWIVIATRANLEEAIAIATTYTDRDFKARVVRDRARRYDVVIGPEEVSSERDKRAELGKDSGFPKWLTFSMGADFAATVWQLPPSPVLAHLRLSETPTGTLTYGDITVAVTTRTAEDKGLVAVFTATQAGKTLFSVPITDAVDEKPMSDVTFVNLDPAAGAPQIVVATYTGGAHCCWVTKIGTRDATGSWQVVDAETLDGEGYRFERLGEGPAVQLINYDNRFLYAFDCYNCSYEPLRITRLVDGKLEEATHDPAFRFFHERHVLRLEWWATTEPWRWRTNGFLAGWVASKAIIGERDRAWARMLKTYDRTSEFGPTRCLVDKPIDECPEGQEQKIPFPRALREHLQKLGYW